MNIAQTPAQGLWLAVSKMTSAARKNVVRYAILGWSDADVEEWHRLVGTEKKRRQRAEKPAAVPVEDNLPTGPRPDVHEDASGTASPLSMNDERDTEPPSPQTPLPRATAPTPAREGRTSTAATDRPPTLDDVLKFAAGCLQGILPEVAEAYFDNRSASSPPWTLESRVPGGERQGIGDWRHDLRTFARKWRGHEERDAVILQAKLDRLSRPFGTVGTVGSSVTATPAKPAAAVPTRQQITDWLADHDNPRFRAKAGEWASWEKLPNHAREELTEHLQTTSNTRA